MRARYEVITGVFVFVLCAFAMNMRVSADGKRGSITLDDSCDYTCLTSFVDLYLKALTAHDPSLIPLADPVKFTENTSCR